MLVVNVFYLFLYLWMCDCLRGDIDVHEDIYMYMHTYINENVQFCTIDIKIDMHSKLQYKILLKKRVSKSDALKVCEVYYSNY